ncbi:hypothetical protein K8352_17490 [Flavobacteriaceae bacterium F89]|uniref:Uncharacterized protein n=1 Tax=Cerina litoralis TaxID=2874477 RepID=A0AAE3EY86_9FLAO|nr:hypothetical protein [Cerina litoralis]MCG2462559.1 hypothetical protein [Cerina litoralis]
MSNISLQNLKNEKALLEKKLTIVKLMIDAYSESENILNSDYIFESSISEMNEVPIDDFPFNKKWIDKLLFLLDQKKRFLNNHELAEALTLYYPEYNIDKLKRKVSVTISAAYKNKTVDGLVKVKVNNLPKGNVWGYEKWLTDNQEIKNNHIPFGMDLNKDVVLE